MTYCGSPPTFKRTDGATRLPMASGLAKPLRPSRASRCPRTASLEPIFRKAASTAVTGTPCQPRLYYATAPSAPAPQATARWVLMVREVRLARTSRRPASPATATRSGAQVQSWASAPGEALATAARRRRNKPRHLDTRTVDRRSVDVGKQPAIRPDLPSNRGPTLAWAATDPRCGQLECPVRADLSSHLSNRLHVIPGEHPAQGIVFAYNEVPIESRAGAIWRRMEYEDPARGHNLRRCNTACGGDRQRAGGD